MEDEGVVQNSPQTPRVQTLYKSSSAAPGGRPQSALKEKGGPAPKIISFHPWYGRLKQGGTLSGPLPYGEGQDGLEEERERAHAPPQHPSQSTQSLGELRVNVENSPPSPQKIM